MHVRYVYLLRACVRIQFVADFRLADKRSKHMRSADLDRMFIAVDARAAKCAREEASASAAQPPAARRGSMAARGGSGAGNLGQLKTLGRVEWLFALIQLALLRYMTSGRLIDASEAAHTFLHTDLRAPPDVAPLVADPDDFRRLEAYTPAVCQALATHVASLRAIFEAACAAGHAPTVRLAPAVAGGGASGGGGGGTVGGGGSARRASACGGGGGGSPVSSPSGSGRVPVMPLSVWLDLMRLAGIVGPDVTVRDATVAFMRSRMVVADGSTHSGTLKESHLPFEGFLEALWCVWRGKGGGAACDRTASNSQSSSLAANASRAAQQLPEPMTVHTHTAVNRSLARITYFCAASSRASRPSPRTTRLPRAALRTRDSMCCGCSRRATATPTRSFAGSATGSGAASRRSPTTAAWRTS